MGIEVIATDQLGFAMLARQSVRDKFSALQEDGLLTHAEASAARQLKTYADAYYTGVTGAYQGSVDGGSRPGDGMINKLFLANKVTDALNSLNSELRKVCVSFVLEGAVPYMGHTFGSIGEYFVPGDKDAGRKIAAGKAVVVAMCRQLAIHMGMQSETFRFDVGRGAAGVSLRGAPKVERGAS